MTRRFGLILIAAVIIVAAIRFYEPTLEVANYPSANSGIVAFGDSLVAGLGSEQGGGFVALLSEELGQPIVNLGRSGDTTESALSRVGEVTRRKPALTVILIGGNDFLQRVPQKETIENLERLITLVQASGSAVLLVGLEGGLLGGNQGEIFENLADKHHTAYVPDILDGIYGREKLMADPLHPNDEGYQIIAERILPTLEKLTE